MTAYEIHYNSDDWAALYVDGQLDTVGDTSNTEERAFSLLGVTQVYDSAFMRGQNYREGVAQTLADVEAHREVLRKAQLELADVRRKIQELRDLEAELKSELRGA